MYKGKKEKFYFAQSGQLATVSSLIGVSQTPPSRLSFASTPCRFFPPLLNLSSSSKYLSTYIIYIDVLLVQYFIIL